MSKLYAIDVYVARLFMVCLFLPADWQTWAMAAPCAWFVFRTVGLRSFPPAHSYLWALLIGSGYLLYVGAVALTPPAYRNMAMHFCERRASLLALPLILSFIAHPLKKIISGELIYFAYGTFIACALGNADYAYHYFFVHGGLHEFSHVIYRIIFESFTGIHPTYMGLYLSFSVCILLVQPPGRLHGALRYGLMFLLLVFLLSLLAKSPVIAMVFIFLHYGYTHRAAMRRHRLLVAGMLAGLAVACIAIPFARQRIAEIPQFLGIGKAGNSTVNSFYDRKMIFNTDVAMLRHYWLTGVGPARLQPLLQQRYFFHSITRQSPTGYFDPHNEYLSEWLSFGILGIALFACILAIHITRAAKAKDYLYLYLLLILYITFFTETVLSRQQGVIFFALFTSLFFFRRWGREVNGAHDL